MSQNSSNVFWNSIELNYRSEKDVETRFIVPLVEALGWPKNEMHSDVPVEFFTGRKRGRKPAADFALAPPSNEPPKKAWIVIEAKSPNETLEGAREQAFSYTYALKAPFYLTTNGVELELWQTGYFDENRIVFSSKLADLAHRRGELELIFSKQAVLNYCLKHSIPTLTIASIDIHPYLESLDNYLKVDGLISRNLNGSNKNVVTVISNGNNTQFNYKDGDLYFLSAWGGRGKSTIIQMLVKLALTNNDEQRVPIPLDAILFTGNQSIFEEIAKRLDPCLPQVSSSQQATKEWLLKVPSLILIDNWDILTERQMQSVANELTKLKGFPVVVFIASRPNVKGPIGFQEFELGQYTELERNRVIDENTGSRVLSYRLLQNVPTGLMHLLSEPVILGKYLDLQLSLEAESEQKPSNLSELMDQLLQALLKSRNFKVTPKADFINHVCRKIAADSKNNLITIDGISKALRSLHSDIDPFTFRDEMISYNIWERINPENCRFNHDIWRVYFLSSGLFNVSNEPNINLEHWLKSANPGEILMMTPFAAEKIISDSEYQTFLSFLLDKDLESYLHALNQRNKLKANEEIEESEKRFYLEELLAGRVDLVERYFPKLKSLLYPWSHIQANIDPASVKPVIAGNISEDGFSFKFGLSSIDSEFVLNSRNEFKFLRGSHSHIRSFQNGTIGPKSGRKLASFDLLKEIVKLIENDSLPSLGWVSRERFRTWIQSLRPIKNWPQMKVSEVNSWIDEMLLKTQKEMPEFSNELTIDNLSFSTGRKNIRYRELRNLADSLIKAGLGDVTIEQLGLPGPDLNNNGQYFSDLYSTDQKIKRISALYDAVMETYLLYCEELFPQVKQHFFYAQCPCRHNVELQHSIESPYSNWTYWLEPTVNQEKTIVAAPEEEREPMNRLRTITDTSKEKYKSLKRNYKTISVTSTSGDWNPWGTEVSDVVMKMLKNDFNDLIGSSSR